MSKRRDIKDMGVDEESIESRRVGKILKKRSKLGNTIKESLMEYESSRKFIPSKKRKKGPQPRGSGKKMKEESPLWEVGPYSGSGGGSRSRA